METILHADEHWLVNISILTHGNSYRSQTARTVPIGEVGKAVPDESVKIQESNNSSDIAQMFNRAATP